MEDFFQRLKLNLTTAQPSPGRRKHGTLLEENNR